MGHVGPRAAVRGGAVRARAGGRDVHARLRVTHQHKILIVTVIGLGTQSLVCYMSLVTFVAEVRGSPVW